MRIILLACSVLALTTAAASAQTTYVGPWQPRPTIGVALGALDEPFRENHHTNLLLSGTFEFPFSDEVRLRVEGGRSKLRIAPGSDTTLQSYIDTPYVSRLTISMARLARPGAVLSGYGGIGIGFYRLRQGQVRGPLRGGLYGHGGGELPVSDSITLNAEIGVHVVGRDFVRQYGILLGEAVLRVKVGL